jgi:hypothetical protein
MARRFVSPGVFTREIDASFLAQGVGAIGAALIGTAPKGPAFVPMTVTTFDEFTTFFGDLNEDYVLTYAAKAYLKNSSVANIVRVLGPTGTTADGTAVNPGYTAESMWAIVAVTGTNSAKIQALLEITASHDLVITDKTSDTFVISITGSEATTDPAFYGETEVITASFQTGSTNYIEKVLNTDPTKFASLGYYVRDVYSYSFQDTAGGNAVYSSASYSGMTALTLGYSSGETPWIKSQEFGGGTEYNLFRFYTLGHGEAENGRFKVSVKNVQSSQVPSVTDFGKFDVEVRTFGDVDSAPTIVESFPGCTMDPNDKVNFFVKRIGDRYWEYDQTEEKMVAFGDYDNQSSFIRVEITTGSYPDAALPWGFRGYSKPGLMYISGTSGDEGDLAANVNDAVDDLPYVQDLTDKATGADRNKKFYWGVEFQRSGSIAARLTRLPALTASDTDFSLTNVSGNAVSNFAYVPGTTNKKSPGTADGWTTLDPDRAKFTLPFAFGFDGWDRTIEDPIEDETRLLTLGTIGVQALRQAVDIISDPDFIDINVLTIPGVYSDQVVEYTINKIEDRADAFYILDITASSTDTATTNVVNRGFDTNYAAAYYSDVKVRDPNTGKAIRLPSSVPALGALAYNDRVSFPWFAPAGLNRGGLNIDTIGFDVLMPIDRLSAANRDKLYENRINPIASFPGQGNVIWGQKTLQSKSSALDRINVRRLLIKAKKLISSAVKFLVFEPNNANTQTRFRQLVNPILADIQQKQGLDTFKVVMDETTNTPDLIDRNIMAGKIFLVPTRTAEFISVDFVISPAGTSFGE